MTALPLGGIGTGTVALAATGALRQWQLNNTGNHLGFAPHSFFALRLSSLEPPLSYRRLLQTDPLEPHAEPAPLVNDHLDAPGEWTGPRGWPRVRSTEFDCAYPFARVRYDDEWPAEVSVEAYSPFVPLDADASSLPLIDFRLSITNRFEHPIYGWWLASLQNLVGWDGVTPIRDARCASLGGNVNVAGALEGGTAIVMTNPAVSGGDPAAGSMVLWSPDTATAFPQFDDADAALAAVDALKLLGPVVFEEWTDDSIARATAALRVPVRWPEGPSAPGSTWAGGLALPLVVQPGETVTRSAVYAWHFPNRVADFDRFGDSDDAAFVAPLVGNHYATRFADASDVIRAYAKQADDLHALSRSWRDAVHGSSLPAAVVETLAAQPAFLRSPTVFRTSDGTLFGFEGVLGESTLNWNGNVGGSCPLNCSHVWNYEQAVSRLFPELERTMRRVDWEVLQAPDGHLPHRVLLPLDGPQLWDRPIGGPTRPALDGMLGAVLKTYREARQGGSDALIERYLPHALRLLEYVTATWDPTGSGVLTGDQPVTHDISLQGPNMFVGGLWLAALRSLEEMARRAGRADDARALRRRFDVSARAYDDALWNGEYYAQQSAGDDFDFGSGCLSDQHFGQWWAHQLGLGHLLPAEHVRTTLRSIVTYNLRHGFRDFQHGYRVFADADDSGLLICTWPHGGRPDVPIRYADEVWTGVEYQVAAHCCYEGLVEEGLAIVSAVRGRYDGSRRNPYNEIECGDHYARAMSGWTLLEAYTGTSYDALDRHLVVGARAGRQPVVAVTGWGELVDGRLHCHYGTIEVARLTVGGRATPLDVPLDVPLVVRAGEQVPLPPT
jgi:uncharacterized protein (DUF608 family)